MEDHRKKIVTVLGTRPQFIKAAAVSHHLRRYFTEVIVNTGQHYDTNMSDIFFQELEIPAPVYQLNVGPGSHGVQTGAMLASIENVLSQEKPDLVLVYGDTNSTLAGALAASKMLIPVAHVEAGMRSFNKAMPEEQNRIVTDHLSTICFTSTKTALNNLRNEGIVKNVVNTGDVMNDVFLHFSGIAETGSRILDICGLKREGYDLCTIHRAENTNDHKRLRQIVGALNDSKHPIAWPVHPRTKKYMEAYGVKTNSNIKLLEPVGYLDMVMLEKHAARIITDSGGVQKEAYFVHKPCITLRDETEWVETVESGWNVLVGADGRKITEALRSFKPKGNPPSVFGSGDASEKIVEYLIQYTRA